MILCLYGMPSETTSKLHVFKREGVWHFSLWTNGEPRIDGELRIKDECTDDEAIEAAREMWIDNPSLGELTIERSVPPGPPDPERSSNVGEPE